MNTPSLTHQWISNPKNYQSLLKATRASFCDKRLEVLHTWISKALAYDRIQKFYDWYLARNPEATDVEVFLIRRALHDIRYRLRKDPAQKDALSFLVNPPFQDTKDTSYSFVENYSSPDDHSEDDFFFRDYAHKLLSIYKGNTSTRGMLITRIMEGILYSGLSFYGAVEREGISKAEGVRLHRLIRGNPRVVRIITEVRNSV